MITDQVWNLYYFLPVKEKREDNPIPEAKKFRIKENKLQACIKVPSARAWLGWRKTMTSYTITGIFLGIPKA